MKANPTSGQKIKMNTEMIYEVEQAINSLIKEIDDWLL